MNNERLIDYIEMMLKELNHEQLELIFEIVQRLYLK